MLNINKSYAKVNHSKKKIVLNYCMFSSGRGVSTFERWGKEFVIWLSNQPQYNDYHIYISQTSEPLSSAGVQSEGNQYFQNYKRIAHYLKGREVTLISDSDSPAFSSWIWERLGWKTLPYHWHFSQMCTYESFYKGGVTHRIEGYTKRFITINGNMQNEHKPMVMKMWSDLNLWDSSYFSFHPHQNFGMKIYRDKDDLYRIFGNLIPLFKKSFLYVVTETVSDNYYEGTNIPMDFMSKMGRALWYPTPFVVVGNFGVLRRLREMGFKTFDSFWDESYDEMWELDKRMKYIYSLIEWISNLSDSDVLEMRNGMIPIFEHNREVLKRLNEKESLETSEIFTTFGYEEFEYETMLKYELENTSVYYHKELDGGGTTFGVQALRGEEVQKRIVRGNILELCSGPGFMGAYLNDIGLADKLYLSDVNIENEECIDRTIKQNGLKNVKFIQSSVFEMIPTELKFDTIISNPPHFATNRVEGYRSNHEKLISLDEDMKIHKCIFEDADKYLNPNGRLILVENATGISEEDIKKLIGNKWGIEYVEYSDYNWKGKSTFYTIILYLL
jgi:hypothetical protein